MTNTEELIETATAADAARLRLIGAVVRARITGTSWQEIADTLGISKQTAYNRYNSYIPTEPELIALVKNTIPEAPATPSKTVDDAPAQLAGQTSIQDAGHPDDDPARREAFRRGELSTAGTAVDWSKAGETTTCSYCGQKNHANKREATETFWIYEKCTPTKTDVRLKLYQP